METEQEKAERFENGLISENETEEYFLGKVEKRINKIAKGS